MNRSSQPPEALNERAALAGRSLRGWATVTRWLLWLLAGLWGVFILTWLVLQAWIVPRIGEWRPELERWASKAVGVPVVVGDIRAVDAPKWGGVLPALVPSFELIDVRLLDPQGRTALQLPVVRSAVSVTSIWRGRFEQILIERPVLDIRRHVDGRIEVAGIDFSGRSAGGGSGADWFFDQAEFVVRQGTVRWRDDQRAQPTLELTALDFVSRNRTRTHELRLDATPEPAWGERFSLRARLREPLLDLEALRRPAQGAPWRRWSGDIYAEFARADVARLQAHVDLGDWGLQVRGGQGALRAWSRLQDGRIDQVTLDAALREVDLQLGDDLPPLALDHASGRVEASWSDSGAVIQTDTLAFRTREGLDWPGGSLRVEHTLARERQGASTSVQAERIELDALAAIAERVPLPDGSHEWLQRLAPTGRIDALDLRWQARGSGPSARRVLARAKGRVSALTLAGEPSGRLSNSGRFPLPGRPGIEGAAIDFELDQDGGQASLSLRDGALSFPDVFDQPRLDMARLDARLHWRLRGERIDVHLDDMRFENADAQGRATAHWHTADPTAQPGTGRVPGVLDLTARLERAQAGAVHRYLPLTVPESARRYVRDAVRGGRLDAVDFRIQGDIGAMPFDNAGATAGTFRIGAQLVDIDFDYVPDFLQTEGGKAWPGVRGVNAKLLLDRTALRIEGIEGGVDASPGVRLSDSAVNIDDLGRETTVQVDVRARGPAAELIGFVQRSPVDTMTRGALARTRASGPAQVDVALSLPLWAMNEARVRGDVRLEGNDLRITPDSPWLTRTHAALGFTQDGFAFTGARTQLLGGELVFDGNLRKDEQGTPRLLIRGQGTASAAGLRDGGFGQVSRLFQHASGSTAYTAQLGFREGTPELQVTSNLVGIALNLPEPLRKPAEQNWPLRYVSQVLDSPGQAPSTERLALQLGPADAPALDLLIERDIRGPARRVLRGALASGLAAGERPATPVSGMAAQARWGEVNVDAWRPLVAALDHGELASASAALPLQLSVRADALTVQGRRFQRVAIGAARDGALWRADVDAEELNGYVEFRPASSAVAPSPGTAGSVYARLTRLNLSGNAPTEVDRLLQQPSSVPALDIAVDDLRWDGVELGRIEIDAVNRGGPTRVGEWRLNALRATLPEARLSASGNWAPLAAQADAVGAAPGQRRTALNFKLEVDDSGALLTRFGRAGLVRGGKGSIEGNIGWLGTPFSLDHASLGGAVKLDVQRGQFLKVDPGAGRLLGVLSLQALPRRLALDFRDVFSEGFAFDFVRGDARVERGVMFTNNLQMKGVNAAVLMEGTADLARETQDLKVVVVPELNAGTASLIATAINPAIGLGTFLAQYLLRQPLQSAATQEFHITGGWADPQVDKVARSAPNPAPDTTPPAPTLQ